MVKKNEIKSAIKDIVEKKLKKALAEEEQKQSVKLRDFLKKSQKTKEEFLIKKTENICCPDCGFNLYDGGKSLTLCICYGEDWDKNIKIEKSENTIKMKFPKNIDPENIEMLLNTLKNINKE